MESKHTPDIRINGFLTPWNMKYIYETASRRKVINVGLQEKNLLSLSYGKIKRKDINQKTGLLPASYETYQIVEDGTIVFRFTDLQNDQKSLRVGLAKERGIVSSAYVCVDGNNELVDDDFFYWLLHYYDTQKVFYKMGAGIRQSINAEDLKELKLLLPVPNEQRSIASLCKLIDDTILNQQEKCETLRKLKSALLDKLFPTADTDRPELRIGHKDDLRKIKAIEVFTTISQKGFSELPILSASQEYGMILRSENGIEMSYGTSNISGYKRVQPHQFVIHLRSFQGGFAHSDIEGITSPAYTILQFKETNKHDDYYWKYLLTSPNFIKRLEAITYGIRDGKSIKFEDVANLVFYVPSWKEQQRIGELLKTYDKLIALNEKKLEKLRNLKSAMLDKLFV